MEAVADRVYEQGIHVSTVSPDIFVAGLLSAGLLTREIEGSRSNEPVGRSISEETAMGRLYLAGWGPQQVVRSERPRRLMCVLAFKLPLRSRCDRAS